MNTQNGKHKTALCRQFTSTGECKFGDRCNFAHGQHELRRPQRKIQHPCWWYNQQSGCSKTSAECAYQHIRVANLRKPIHLQHPCVWMHVRTPGHCRSGDKCGGDHDYELTKEEWETHFPDIPFAGAGYFSRKKATVTDEFPTLTPPIKVNKPHPVWGEPLSVLKKPPTKEQILEQQQENRQVAFQRFQQRKDRSTNYDYDEDESSEEFDDEWLDSYTELMRSDSMMSMDREFNYLQLST